MTSRIQLADRITNLEQFIACNPQHPRVELAMWGICVLLRQYVDTPRFQ